MEVHLGIDIGAVGLKAALLAPRAAAEGIESLSSASSLKMLSPAQGGDLRILVVPYRRTRGRPLEAARNLLIELRPLLERAELGSITFTGSGAGLVAEALGTSRCNEFQSITRALNLLHPEVRTVFEMGGETSKYLHLAPDPSAGTLGIVDYGTNGDCAAGTGAFLDQQAGRLEYAIEEIGEIVSGAERAAQIAGRCSVFAKSDMIHAQQKGFSPPEVLRGLCKAVAANFKSAVVRGRTPEPPVALVGGVSANTAVVNEVIDIFELAQGRLIVPEAAESMAAVGAAIIGQDAGEDRSFDLDDALARIDRALDSAGHRLATSPPLSLDRVTLLRDQVRPYTFPTDDSVVDAYLGLDIGSVGTKIVVIDDAGHVVHWIFTRTQGRPIEVVSHHLLELQEAVGRRIRIRGVGTTGSGRELIGELVGADAIVDEITCHKSGASLVGDRLLGRRPDTIFEIGGQDSKYISLEPEAGDSGESVVVDFTMNEACAAGTGSFLEERAEELDVSIKGEFADLALRSKAPLKLGERCTVFMERDVNTCMQRGARREDIIAGLAYSVVYNYINRVVRGRRIGETIFFQGGTAYNDAVAAAFAAVTGKEIIVPPHNVMMGAIGAALMAREKIESTGQATRFRGYDMSQVDYTLREFMCKGCGNLCSVQEFKVEEEKTFWGDKCSDRYRKRAKTETKPVIPDLVALRRELLHADGEPEPAEPRGTIGMPMAMYTHDLLPLWRGFFKACGFKVELSEETNRRTVHRGSDCVVAEPCFPIIVAHGHVADLVDRGVDYVWLPNVMSAETKFTDNESHVCPWGQTLPFVLRQAPAFRNWNGRLLCPTIRFREGNAVVRKALLETATRLGVPKKTARRAFEIGQAARERFQSAYLHAGREALDILDRTGAPGMVLVGRPYNIHDPGVSISTAKKLRDHYGVNVIPVDAMPVADVDIRDINDNMFWEYGRRILAAAKIVADRPNLHIIYITNFKCGPDSFVKGFIRPASKGKPFLTLQYDAHANDAGVMTRCEAYLDSKGILRWWRNQDRKRTEGKPSPGEPSTSPKWPTPEPGSLPPPSVPSESMPTPRPTQTTRP